MTNEPWYLAIPLTVRQQIESLPPTQRWRALSPYYWAYVHDPARKQGKPRQQVMFPTQPNPPWANRVIKDNWDTLVANVPAALLPTRQQLAKAELGAGHYGVVYETLSQDVVLKITTDITEAKFVAKAIELAKKDDWPVGIVKYHGIVPLVGSHRKRPVFALWRESADDVGELCDYARLGDLDKYKLHYSRPKTREEKEMRETYQGIRRFIGWANKLRNSVKQLAEKHNKTHADVLKHLSEQESDFTTVEDPFFFVAPRWLKGEKAAITYYDLCRQQLLIMEDTNDILQPMAAAMRYYFDKNILLADVHCNNTGRILRRNYGDTVIAITDPGHAIGDI